MYSKSIVNIRGVRGPEISSSSREHETFSGSGRVSENFEILEFIGIPKIAGILERIGIPEKIGIWEKIGNKLK